MVRAKLRFTKEYENTYKRCGANITIIRNGRQYFFRMFDPDLSPQELRNRYGWQACKKISIERNATDGEIFKENITKYGGFFGKMTWGRATIEKSRRTRDSLTDPKEYFNDKIENFSELNEVLAVELMKLAVIKKNLQIKYQRKKEIVIL
ncbi:unnamed protein product [Rhizophagus irregularis]|nr:unnamed protein product [Rhizophagus irregularis]